MDGYIFNNVTRIKYGTDRIWRSNKFRRISVFFSENEVYVYTKTINTLRNQADESTDVYFYDDIVSVSTSSETETILGRTINYEAFKITTKGGTSLSIPMLNKVDTQRSINEMRNLLKSKKNR